MTKKPTVSGSWPVSAAWHKTATKSDGREGWVAPFRTEDGGLTWERIAWIGDEPAGENDFAIMPSTVRLGPEKLLTVIRHRVGGPRRADDRTWLTSFLSEDNGITWQQLEDPVTNNINSPSALIQLPDGRLVLAYIHRPGGRIAQPDGDHDADGSRVCIKISSDEGKTWGPEIVLRGKEGASGDVGYPRIVQRPDGKLVITCYWNNAMNPGENKNWKEREKT
jgi:Neuraminidase (sialidase)